MKVKIIETAGFYPSMLAMRLPHQSVGDSRHGMIGDRDLELAEKLIKAGDEHAKCIRGIVAWIEITAPVGWWMEMVTYRIGAECLSSTSTMHTECKNLLGDELRKAKYSIPLGHEQTRVIAFSYQTLRRIWKQRRNHRLPECHEFLSAISTLPYANELIFIE